MKAMTAKKAKRNRAAMGAAVLLAAALCGCGGAGGAAGSVAESRDASGEAPRVVSAESDIVLTDAQTQVADTALDRLGFLLPEERTEARIRAELEAMEADGLIDAGSVRFYKESGLFLFNADGVPCAFSVNADAADVADGGPAIPPEG